MFTVVVKCGTLFKAVSVLLIFKNIVFVYWCMYVAAVLQAVVISRVTFNMALVCVISRCEYRRGSQS